MNDHDRVVVVGGSSEDDCVAVVPGGQVVAISLVAVDGDVLLTRVASDEDDRDVLVGRRRVNQGEVPVFERPGDELAVFDGVGLDGLERRDEVGVVRRPTPPPDAQNPIQPSSVCEPVRSSRARSSVVADEGDGSEVGAEREGAVVLEEDGTGSADLSDDPEATKQLESARESLDAKWRRGTYREWFARTSMCSPAPRGFQDEKLGRRGKLASSCLANIQAATMRVAMSLTRSRGTSPLLTAAVRLAPKWESPLLKVMSPGTECGGAGDQYERKGRESIGGRTGHVESAESTRDARHGRLPVAEDDALEAELALEQVVLELAVLAGVRVVDQVWKRKKGRVRKGEEKRGGREGGREGRTDVL